MKSTLTKSYKKMKILDQTPLSIKKMICLKFYSKKWKVMIALSFFFLGGGMQGAGSGEEDFLDCDGFFRKSASYKENDGVNIADVRKEFLTDIRNGFIANKHHDKENNGNPMESISQKSDSKEKEIIFTQITSTEICRKKPNVINIFVNCPSNL